MDMVKTPFLKFLFLVLLASMPMMTFALTMESPQRIKEITENFVKTQIPTQEGTNIKIEANVYADEFRVPACRKDITPSLPQNSNKEKITNVELRCMDLTEWRILVPVNVAYLTDVVVAKQTLTAHEKLKEELLDYAQMDINKLYEGYFTSKEDVIGFESNYLIAAGTVINKRNIKQPTLVRANQAVTLISEKGSIIVSMQGVAQTDGALNGVIKVSNPISKRTVDAVVIGPNQAKALS